MAQRNGPLRTGWHRGPPLRTGWRALLLVVVIAGCDGGGPVPPVNQAPVVTITAPPDASSFLVGESVTFAGTATDPEDGALPANALTWTSDHDGGLGAGATLTLNTLSVGQHVVTLTAPDSQGLAGSATVRVTIARANTPPQATIDAPLDGATFRQGETIEFRGTGTDAEDGPLPAESLVWTSDRDGQIGGGPALFVSNLSAGVHVITLSVTDTGGAQGTARLTLTVTAVNAPPVATINSPASGATFQFGTPIAFIGSVVDAEDGVLKGDDVVWSSSRDGQLGTGTAFVLDNLSVGTHTIVLLAMDLDGAAGTDTVTITVEQPTPDTGDLTVIID